MSSPAKGTKHKISRRTWLIFFRMNLGWKEVPQPTETSQNVEKYALPPFAATAKIFSVTIKISPSLTNLRPLPLSLPLRLPFHLEPQLPQER